MNGTLVQVQTIQSAGGVDLNFKAVHEAVAKRNAQNPKSPAHISERALALPSNTKGMQVRLSVLATVARKNDVTMIRLSFHGGDVALCGTPKAIAATKAAADAEYNRIATIATNAYSPDKHGARVSFLNGFQCGMVAGIQDAAKIKAVLAYGVGFLYTFPAPNEAAYELGYKAGLDRPAVARTPRAPRVTKVVAPQEQVAEAA